MTIQTGATAPLSEVEAALRLLQIPGFSQYRAERLAKKYQLNLPQLLTLPAVQLHQLGFNQQQVKSITEPDIERIEISLKWCQGAPSRAIIPASSNQFPSLLKHIASCPPVIFVEGNADLLSGTQLALVGSRHPTAAGKALATTLSAQLSQCGWIITSGLALGIDGCCHQGALNAGGNTLAVVATGLDIVYPRRHRRLREAMLDAEGCIVSEFEPGTRPLPEYFPRRNRIISGLSRGVLVVEAALKSGSLITARYALEQNREVFAVPGNIHNAMTKGCHYLIKQGAKLVEGVEDINEEFQNLEFIAPENALTACKKSTVQPLASDKLLDSVDYDVTAIDVIAERSNMPIPEVLARLLEYELRGLVAAVQGGYLKLGGK